MVRRKNTPRSSNDSEEYPRTSTPARENVRPNFDGSDRSSISGIDGTVNNYLDLTESTATLDPPNQSDPSSRADINYESNSSQATTNQSDTSSRTDADSVPESNSSQATTDSIIRRDRGGRIRNGETATETNSSRSSTDYTILHRTRSGRISKRETVAEREIRFLQATTHSLIKVAPFTRIVKEMMEKVTGGRRLRISAEAIEALMEASEASLLALFEASCSATAHARRTTLMVEDIRHVKRILSLFGTQV